MRVDLKDDEYRRKDAFLGWCATICIVWIGTIAFGMVMYWAYLAVIAIQACSL